jgi:5-methylcytosine-specific restriction protein A
MSKPDWSRDELILALELYFREPMARGSKTHPEVVNLSKILNQLPIHQGQALDDAFRNPSGVAMKLSNFLRLDPGYEGKGLSRGSKLEEEVWNTFVGDTERLMSVASVIRNVVVAGEASVERNVEKEEQEQQEAPEGKILTRMHMIRERSSKLVVRKKGGYELGRETGMRGLWIRLQ